MTTILEDTISRQAAIDAIGEVSPEFVSASYQHRVYINKQEVMIRLMALPPVQLEIIRCKDCKHWRRAIVYGQQLSCGYCESDEMWQSLYGETCEVEHIDTEEDHYCSYGERKDDE